MKRNKTIHEEQYRLLIDCLYKERKRLGLSQKEVADALNMQQSDISKIETSERRIDVLEFKKLLLFYRLNDNLKLQEVVLTFLGIEKNERC